MTLAGFFSVRGATRADAIDEDLWSNAAVLTGFRSALLKELKDRFDKNLPPSLTNSRIRALPQRFTRLFDDVRASREIMPAGEGVTLNDKSSRRLTGRRRKIKDKR